MKRYGIAKSNKGFTLTEMVIVMAVISILMAIIIPTYSNTMDRYNEKLALERVKVAKDQYYSQNNVDNSALVHFYFVYDEYAFIVNGYGELSRIDYFDSVDKTSYFITTYDTVKIYHPANEAFYTIEFYLQVDGVYELSHSQKSIGYVGTETTVVPPQVEGYTVNNELLEQAEISLDGSAVVKVYYDKNA